MTQGLFLFLVKEWEQCVYCDIVFLVKFRWFFGVANHPSYVGLYNDVKLK